MRANFTIRNFITKWSMSSCASASVKDMEKGLAQGMAQGALDNAMANAKVMKADGMPVALIAKYTGLSEEQVAGI